MKFQELYEKLVREKDLTKFIDQLTPEQYEDYKKIAVLMNQGKFVEFEREYKKFKKKHGIK